MNANDVYLRSSEGQTALRAWGGTTEYKAVDYNSQARSGDSNLKLSLNMIAPSKLSAYTNFDRFYSIYPEYELSSFRQYVFIVRPDLNIINSRGSSSQVSSTCSNDSLIRDTCLRRPYIARQLTDTLDGQHDFMTFLVGRTESLQVPDLSLKAYTISQPYTNYLMPYAGNAIESQTGGTFEITFREDAELNIHRLFSTYIRYIDGVKRGLFKPKQKYTDYNKYDYMTSVYYIVCGPDGRKILWFSKYTGAFPTNCPDSDLSFNLRGTVDPKCSVSFQYFMHEALDPDILVDFNENSRGSTRYQLDAYDSYVGGTGSGLAGSPFITIEKNEYRLNWRDL